MSARVYVSRVGIARVGVSTYPYVQNRAGRRDLGRRQVKTTPDLCFLPSLILPIFILTLSLSISLLSFPSLTLSRHTCLRIYIPIFSVHHVAGVRVRSAESREIEPLLMLQRQLSFHPLTSVFYSFTLHRSREYVRTCVCVYTVSCKNYPSVRYLLFTLLPRFSFPSCILTIKRCPSHPDKFSPNVILRYSRISSTNRRFFIFSMIFLSHISQVDPRMLRS